MYVKLINPTSKQTMTFACVNEAYYEPREAMDIDAQQAWQTHYADMGYDARRLAVWPGAETGVALRMAQILIPLPREKQIAILTNWEAWLCNEQGRSIDRIHRFVAG
jgi:hypothetical protein